MANECEYHLMAVGKENASLDRLLSIMRNKNAEFYIYRVFSAAIAEDEEEGSPHKAGDFWSMEIKGTVAWSCAQWMEALPKHEIKSDDGATYTNLPTLCKMLNVAVEIWAEEEDVGFQQHIVVDNKGTVIKNDEKEFTHIYGYDELSEVVEGGVDDYGMFANPVDEIWNDTGTLNRPSPAKTPAEKRRGDKNPVAKNRFTDGFWEYETETNGDTGTQCAIITGMKGEVGGSVKIPAVINKIPVTGITRAKERAVILGTSDALQHAIKTKVERDTGIELVVT